MSDIVQFFIDKFRELLSNTDILPSYYRPRTYRNSAVRFRDCSIDEFEERRDILINDSGLNVFLFPANKIPGCDLLSDSGTTTMTMQQWAELFMGDESYGTNEGFQELKLQILETFGQAWCQKNKTRENMFIFHQGRSAEFALFSNLAKVLAKKEKKNTTLSSELPEDLHGLISKKLEDNPNAYYIIPNNAHFDTTEANIANSQFLPLNLPCKKHMTGDESCKFRGNINLDALRALLTHERDRIPMIYLTITNNTGGGQPVALENIKAVRALSREFNVPFFFDACRFSENAWYIKNNEPVFADKSIQEIVHDEFEQVDGFHISLKKDGLVNMGGAIIIREDGLFPQIFPQMQGAITDHQILIEGHPTYGGLTGRDIKALIQGLKQVVNQNYLDSRIGQVQRSGQKLSDLGIPIINPVGGHAVYLNMDIFHVVVECKDEDYKGLSFRAPLMIAGLRIYELR
ncbi:MAG: tryptophanase, partial [Planctomycetes bacterium]|nr:tryptophanase [Planctomycetota bacterium]